MGWLCGWHCWRSCWEQLNRVHLMPEMTIKEWAAEYRLIDESELEDLRQRLPSEPAERSIRSYLGLCEFVVKLSPDAREAFAEERRRYYLELEARVRKAAERWGYAVPG
jgi:hypothetical protein